MRLKLKWWINKCQFLAKVTENDDSSNNWSDDTDQTFVSPPEWESSITVVHQVSPHAVTTAVEITDDGIFLLRGHIWNKGKNEKFVSSNLFLERHK